MKKWQFFLILFFLLMILFKLELLQEPSRQWFGVGCIIAMTASVIGAGWYFITNRR
jgi:hypothetical protein